MTLTAIEERLDWFRKGQEMGIEEMRGLRWSAADANPKFLPRFAAEPHRNDGAREVAVQKPTPWSDVERMLLYFWLKEVDGYRLLTPPEQVDPYPCECCGALVHEVRFVYGPDGGSGA